MHAISFGTANLPYRSGPVHEFSGHHRVARNGGGDSQKTSSCSPGGILSNLSSSISSLRSQLESLSTSQNLPADGSGDVSASALGAQIINKQRGELQIHTQDGDVVTLKFSGKVAVRMDGEQISDGDTALTNTSLDVRSRSKIAVSVEGDLSDEELAAINDLVDKVGNLTSEFFSGDMENVLTQAMSLSYDTSVLADYSLDLSLRQSVRTYAYAALWSPPKPVATAPAPVATADEPVAPEEAAADEVVATPVETSTEAVVTPVSTEASTAVELADSTDGAPTNSRTAAHIVADFVAKVRSSFHMTATDTSLGMSYEFKAKLLISNIAENAPVEATPDSATLDYLQKQLGVSTAV
jgi:hypothetical protein